MPLNQNYRSNCSHIIMMLAESLWKQKANLILLGGSGCCYIIVIAIVIIYMLFPPSPEELRVVNIIG